jgi:hypothetical protein
MAWKETGEPGGAPDSFFMQTNVSHNNGAALPEAAGHQSKASRALIKLGVDVHARQYVVVAQHGHAAPKPPQRFTPEAFVPWVEGLLRAGHAVHAVYEACGFGFGLQRALAAAGAACVVIAPRKLDEARPFHYCGVIPIVFSHVSANRGHWLIGNLLGFKPNACPPCAYKCISTGTPAFFKLM